MSFGGQRSRSQDIRMTHHLLTSHSILGVELELSRAKFPCTEPRQILKVLAQTSDGHSAIRDNEPTSTKREQLAKNRIQKLRAEIARLRREYHEKNTPNVTDDVYDSLTRELKELLNT